MKTNKQNLIKLTLSWADIIASSNPINLLFTTVIPEVHIRQTSWTQHSVPRFLTIEPFTDENDPLVPLFSSGNADLCDECDNDGWFDDELLMTVDDDAEMQPGSSEVGNVDVLEA